MIKRAATILLTLVMIISLIFYWNFTVFVVHPVTAQTAPAQTGFAQTGATLVVPRTDRLTFVDSADAMCDRLSGQVSADCRAAMQSGAFAASDIYAQLPYFDWLFNYSTGGKPYTE
jgi:hypothetical protein